MLIANHGAKTIEQLAQSLRGMVDGELISQEIVQGGALHALEHLKRIGVTPANVDAMLASLQKFQSVIATECRRRHLPVCDDPGGH